MGDNGPPLQINVGRDLPPLFCVHAVSGSAYWYTPLAEYLDTRQPLYGLEAPGFDDDAAPLASIGELVSHHVDTLRAFRPDGPYLLLGWSMGGVIAFEMAHRLRAAGTAVPLLIVVDSPVPTGQGLPGGEESILTAFLVDLNAAPPGTDFSHFCQGSPDPTPAEVFAAVAAAGVFPPELDVDFLMNLYRIYRTHVYALYAHATTPGYSGPVLAIAAAESPPQPWDRVACSVDQHIIPGNHYTIWTEGIAAMADLIATRLAAIAPSRELPGM
jgi:thioesterase domain-containing protein